MSTSLLCASRGSSPSIFIDTAANGGSSSPMIRRSTADFGYPGIPSSAFASIANPMPGVAAIRRCASGDVRESKATSSPTIVKREQTIGITPPNRNGFISECQKISVETFFLKVKSSAQTSITIDLRESRLYQTSHIRGSRSANCYTKTMAKRAIANWTKWFPDNTARFDITVYDAKSEGPLKTAPLMFYVKYLTGLGHTVFFLQGGFERFKKVGKNSLIESCLSPDTIQQYQCSPTNVENSSEDVLNAAASKILPFLYLGNERDAHDQEILDNLGITHVLNVTATVSFYHQGNSKYRYHRLSATDSQSQDLRKFFNEAFQFIDEARNTHGNVLIHCWAGVSRSATIVMAYLMKNSNFNILQTLDYVRARRTVVAPNFNFMGQLERFHADLEAQHEIRDDWLTEQLIATSANAPLSGSTVSSYNTSDSSLSSESDGTPPSSLVSSAGAGGLGMTSAAVPFLK